MLEALLEHLSSLSSADFYQELAAWKKTVEIGLSHPKPDANSTAKRGRDEGRDERELDYVSAIDPSDVIDIKMKSAATIFTVAVHQKQYY
ncbi:hypothetical protein JG687_00008038 [Phytophthora cactorum]|uniref:Uncharacterized protein n=1 Tax=Phytophthora cactorum TaxID=29920 RepID=A0A8T1UDJ2_9STRA|nr:hypothetical protein JG687_00008038 [Phytophthora cactorum]